MSNQPLAQSLVASLRERLNAGGIGVIRVWGADVVRPSDQIYELKSATLADGTLKLVLFLALDGKERIIEVDQPAGAKAGKSGLRVESAAAIRVFGKEYKPPTPNAGALYVGL